MKLTLILAAIISFLSSCNHYNYYFVSSENLPKSTTFEMIDEDDTLQIEYDFAKSRGNLTLTISNKTDEFVEVDWKKSAIITGGKAYSFYTPQASLNGVIQRDTSGSKNIIAGSSSYMADIKANIFINEPIEFIFPKSHLVKTPSADPITNNLLAVRERTKNEGQLIKIPKQRQFPLTYKKIEFPADNSPLVFRSFLTFRIGKGGNQKEFSKEHSFYISEAWQSEFDESYFPKQLVKRPNRLN